MKNNLANDVPSNAAWRIILYVDNLYSDRSIMIIMIYSKWLSPVRKTFVFSYLLDFFVLTNCNNGRTKYKLLLLIMTEPSLPCFLNLQSSWCLVIAFCGPLKSHPPPAYWQATRVPEQRYFKWSSRLPLCSSSVHESEFGHVTSCLSSSLVKIDK